MTRLFAMFKKYYVPAMLILLFLFVVRTTFLCLLNFSSEKLGVMNGSVKQGYWLFICTLLTGGLVLFILRYSAPVWLWQLCNSDWPQVKRAGQAMDASFLLRTESGDITRQLERMLPALRTQGVSQVVENNSHGFLLRLSQAQ